MSTEAETGGHSSIKQGPQGFTSQARSAECTEGAEDGREQAVELYLSGQGMSGAGESEVDVSLLTE